MCERVKKLLYAYKSFDSWWRAESTSMSVYTVQLACDASHITRRADQRGEKWPCSPICLSGAHLGRGASGLQIHTQCLKSTRIQMYEGWKKKKKKHSPGLCFCLLVPQSTLPVFIDLSMSFGPVSDILSSLSNGQTGSGFVRIKVQCWDKSCPLCAPVSVGAAAGHLLCCVKTHLYGMNAEFQLER